jgi:hypothetical protein
MEILVSYDNTTWCQNPEDPDMYLTFYLEI